MRYRIISPNKIIKLIIYLFTYLFIYLFIYLLIYLFTYLFIYLFIYWGVGKNTFRDYSQSDFYLTDLADIYRSYLIHFQVFTRTLTPGRFVFQTNIKIIINKA